MNVPVAGWLVVMLEGGYNPTALARCVAKYVDVMSGETALEPDGPVSGECLGTIDAVLESHWRAMGD